MADYKALYHYLFNCITDVIEEMKLPENKSNTNKAIAMLMEVQKGAEEQYLIMTDED